MLGHKYPRVCHGLDDGPAQMFMLLDDRELKIAMATCFVSPVTRALKFRLLSGGPQNINAALDVTRRTLFLIYCEFSPTIQLSMIAALTRLGADLNSQDTQQRSGLHWILARCHGDRVVATLPVVEYLLHHGADPLLEDADGDSAFMLAFAPQFATVSLILTFFTTPVLTYKHWNNYDRICHPVISDNNSDPVYLNHSRLLGEICKVHKPGHFTCFHLAAVAYRAQPDRGADILLTLLDIAEAALSHLAVNTVMTTGDFEGNTVLQRLFSPIPVNYGKNKTFDYISGHSSPTKHLRVAPYMLKNWTRRYSPDTLITRLLRYDFNVNLKNIYGSTAFTDALGAGAYISPTVLRMIPWQMSRNHGIDLLVHVLKYGKGEIETAVAFLIAIGVDIRSSPNCDWISLAVANFYSTPSVIAMILAKGCLVDYSHILQVMAKKRLQMLYVLLSSKLQPQVVKSVCHNGHQLLHDILTVLPPIPPQSLGFTLVKLISRLVDLCEPKILSLFVRYPDQKLNTHTSIATPTSSSSSSQSMSLAHQIVWLAIDDAHTTECMKVLSFLSGIISKHQIFGGDLGLLINLKSRVWIPWLKTYNSVSALTYGFALGHYAIVQQISQNFHDSLNSSTSCSSPKAPKFINWFECLCFSKLTTYPQFTETLLHRVAVACNVERQFKRELQQFFDWLAVMRGIRHAFTGSLGNHQATTSTSIIRIVDLM